MGTDCRWCGTPRCEHGNCDRCAGECHACMDAEYDYAMELAADILSAYGRKNLVFAAQSREVSGWW